MHSKDKGDTACIYNLRWPGLPAPRLHGCDCCILHCPCHLFVEAIALDESRWDCYGNDTSSFLHDMVQCCDAQVGLIDQDHQCTLDLVAMGQEWFPLVKKFINAARVGADVLFVDDDMIEHYNPNLLVGTRSMEPASVPQWLSGRRVANEA